MLGRGGDNWDDAISDNLSEAEYLDCRVRGLLYSSQVSVRVKASVLWSVRKYMSSLYDNSRLDKEVRDEARLVADEVSSLLKDNTSTVSRSRALIELHHTVMYWKEYSVVRVIHTPFLRFLEHQLN